MQCASLLRENVPSVLFTFHVSCPISEIQTSAGTTVFQEQCESRNVDLLVRLHHHLFGNAIQMLPRKMKET